MHNQIIELETKIAFQEDMIQALNQTVAAQQRELAELKLDLKELETQLRAIASGLTTEIRDEPPPHY
jgi:SlyX protein